MKIFKVLVSFTFVILMFLSQKAHSQGFGSNPPGVEWKQINTEHYRIIFPAEIENEAQRVANTLEYTYKAESKTLNIEIPKINLLLNNQGAVSNGYVRLGPRMSEWYNTPPQTATNTLLLGTGEWYNLLASHEVRHIFQYEALNKGFTLIMYILFGDMGREAMTALAVPQWVLEGDAVGTETALSNSGRGRLPSFDMEIRALELSDIRYSYYKSWLGSYDDFYPDIYHLGYLMTTHVKDKFGTDKFAAALTKAGKISFWPFAFTASLKSRTKKGASDMYDETMDELKGLWEKQLDGLTFTPATILNKRNTDDWISYFYPQFSSDGTVYAIKYGLGIPQTLVKFNKNGEEIEIEQISSVFPVFKMSGDKAVWNDYGWNLRWPARTYSEVMSYDCTNDETFRLTSGTKLFAPAPSADGKTIVAVQFDENRQCNLVLLNASDRNILKIFPNPENYFITSPTFSPDGKKIAYIKQKFNGKALCIIDLESIAEQKGLSESNEEKTILPESFEEINEPMFFKDYILYGSAYSGIDNIYAVNIETGKKYQVTSRKFGAFNPNISPDGKTLLYNDYSIHGYDIAEMPLEPDKWLPMESVQDRNIRYYEPLIAKEQGKSIFDESLIPYKKYQVAPYYPFLHIFNVHSWTIEPSTLQPGLQVLSDDILGTTEFSAGINYDINQRVFGGNAAVAYGGIFPIFTISAGYTGRSSTETNSDNTVTVTDSWKETTGSFGVQLPFNLSKGIYTTVLSAGALAEMTKVTDRAAFNGWNGLLAPVEYILQFERFKQFSRRDFNPVWGQNLNLSYINTPFKSDIHSSKATGNLSLYFPGLLPHNSLKLEGDYEWQELRDGYSFASTFLFPRGYNSLTDYNLYKFSADYAFPILYPDLALGQWFYFKRIRGDMFFDYGEGRNDYFKLDNKYKSMGGELTVDFQIFAWPILINAGGRYSYHPDEKTERWDIIFNVGG